MRSETSFDLDGDLIMVDAVVVGPLRRAEVRLVFDTGAVLTTLIPSIARAIGYPPEASIRRSRMRSAVAEEPGYIVRVAQLSALGFTLPNFHLDVADLGHGVDGLLGMNFLGEFNLEIRPAELRIFADKIAP
jgi:predicted aspartyl protease